MRKVKVFQIHSDRCYECGGREYATGMSDWTEISDEDFDFLKRHLYLKNKGRYSDQYVVAEQLDDDQVDNFISDLKTMIDTKRMEAAMKKAMDDKKRAEKLERKKAHDLESKRKQLEKLKQELGED